MHLRTFFRLNSVCLHIYTSLRLDSSAYSYCYQMSILHTFRVTTRFVTGCVCACYSHVMSSSNLTRSSISRAGVIFQDHLSRPLFNISGQSVSQPGPQYPCGRELSRQKSTYPGYPFTTGLIRFDVASFNLISLKFANTPSPGTNRQLMY